jgi:ribonuclease VapC
MIVDSSAIVAMLRAERDAPVIVAALAATDHAVLSAANYLEASIVIDRDRNAVLSSRLDGLLDRFAIEIVPVTESQARLARQAYRDFGKHSGHPAKLNFGDCFAFALAKERNEPLLYKGVDFAEAGFPQLAVSS